MLLSPQRRDASGEDHRGAQECPTRWAGPVALTSSGEAVTLDLLLRDLRHMKARAASDLADWLVHLELEGKADRTLYGYHRFLAVLLRAYPQLELSEFTHSEINDVLRTFPARSRHIPRSVFNKFFAWAEFDERIAKSPMGRVPKMPNPKRRPSDIFSEAEQATLEVLPTPDGQLFTVMFGSGIRRGEARRLRLRDADLARARLIVLNGKGGKDRIIPVAAHVLVAVDELATLEGLEPSQHLWYKLAGNSRRRVHPQHDPIGDTTFEGWYKRCLTAAGVRYLNPHQTRHTYGHRLREQDFDLEERQLLMGHESSNTTAYYYGHLTIEDVARKVAQL